jgi:hypothetical protein
MAAQEDVTTTRLTDCLHRAIQSWDAIKVGVQKIVVRTKNDDVCGQISQRELHDVPISKSAA